MNSLLEYKDIIKNQENTIESIINRFQEYYFNNVETFEKKDIEASLEIISHLLVVKQKLYNINLNAELIYGNFEYDYLKIDIKQTNIIIEFYSQYY